MKLVSLLFFLILNSVSSNTDKTRIYYTFTNSAENCIIKDNYKEAIQFYYEAAKIKKLLGPDILNALLASAKLNSKGDILFFSRCLIEKGVLIASLKEYSLLKPFIDTIKAANTNTPLLSSINLTYRNELKEMIERDQKYLKSTESRRQYKDTIDKIFKANALRLVSLIKKYGFPSEELVGLSANNISTICLPIIIHQSSGDKQVVNFSDYLALAIKQGDFDNRLGSTLIELCNGSQNMIYNPVSLVRARFDTFVISKSASTGELIKKDTTWFSSWGTEKISDSTIKAFNQRRKELFLDTVEESFSKSLFNHQNKEFILGSRDNGLTIQFKRLEDFIHMKNSLYYLQ